MARALKRIESIVPRRAVGFGGKALGLATLARAGFPVPAGYAMPGWVCESFCRQILPEDDRPKALVQAAEVDAERLSQIAKRVRDAPLPPYVRTAVTDATRTLRQEGASSFAVRSSAAYEDQPSSSAAGIHRTCLHLETDTDVLEAIKTCWASIFEPRAIEYMRHLPHEPNPTVGVVLQAMVPAEVAGVLFTCNPLTGDATEVVINAAYGLGVTVADGRVAPDTFRIDKVSGQMRDEVLGDKAVRAVLSATGGVREDKTSSAERARRSLDSAQLDELLMLGRRVDNHFGSPRDVEWAFAGGELYVLQARPVTVGRLRGARRDATKREPSRDRAEIVWSNANVGEALPGVATPLTWSVLSNFSDLGFRRAFGALGCTVPKDAELVGDFRGRIYLNMSEIAAILSQVPGVDPSTLVRLGGGVYPEELNQVEQDKGSAAFWLRLPKTVSNFVRENFRLQQRVTDFEGFFAEERMRIDTLDPRLLSPTGLARMLNNIEWLLDETGSVMLTVYARLLVSVLVLVGLLRFLAGSRAMTLHRGLLSGLDNVDSAEPGFALAEVAKVAAEDEPARKLIFSKNPERLTLSALPAGPTKKALGRFIDDFGHRGVREPEIAAPRWREDQSMLFTALRLHLSADGPPLMELAEHQKAIRAQAEQELMELAPLVTRPAVRRLLEAVRGLTRSRERLRGHVIEVLGMVRRVALDASRRIEAQEPEAGSDAAFFLTVDELRRVLESENERVSLFVQRRRNEFERNQALPDPPGTFIGYPPATEVALSHAKTLSGLAASAGVAEGRARVLSSPGSSRRLEPREVLVVPAADVGWAPLFPTASAVVTELGGPLSHAAIVLREYGIPAVVNVQHATSAIRDGDLVRVDGDEGRVDILNER